jgi:hypothetical protein
MRAASSGGGVAGISVSMQEGPTLKGISPSSR